MFLSSSAELTKQNHYPILNCGVFSIESRQQNLATKFPTSFF